MATEETTYLHDESSLAQRPAAQIGLVGAVSRLHLASNPACGLDNDAFLCQDTIFKKLSPAKSAEAPNLVRFRSCGALLMSSPVAVVLAAGRGTRMKSELPKVMFPVLGRPMIHWVIDAMETAGCERCIVVVGYRADDVRQELASRNNISFALQEQQLGTGHAVTMCHEQLKDHAGPVIVVAGDSPLIQAASVKRLFEEFSRGKLTCLLGTLKKDDPTGLGRIVRDAAGKFERIVEQKDATEEQKQIREVNMSTYLFENQALQWALSKLSNSNSQQEYYLTDCPAILRGAGHQVDALPILQPCESLSINTIEELAIVEAKMQELGYGK